MNKLHQCPDHIKIPSAWVELAPPDLAILMIIAQRTEDGPGYLITTVGALAKSTGKPRGSISRSFHKLIKENRIKADQISGHKWRVELVVDP